MSKVLHLMQCTELGGMEQVAYGLMGKMKGDHGVHFRIASPQRFGRGREIVKALDEDAVDFEYRGRFGWRSHGGFRNMVAEMWAGCSVIWVTGTSAASLAAIRGINLRINLPKMLSHHHHHFESWTSWLRWRGFYEVLCRGLDAVVFPTEFTRDEAIRIAPWLKSKTRVIHNGVEPRDISEDDRLAARKRARSRLNLPEDGLIIGNAGWLIPRKRFDVFLRVGALVKKAHPESSFVICGGGPLEAGLRRMANDLGIASSVRFEGWVEKMEPYYQAFDVLLFNSDYDTLPMTVLEAANYGVIVVASLLYGGLPEIIDHGVNGFLFNDHDVPAMADVIASLSRGQDSARIRRNAFQKIRRDFDVGVSAAEYARLVRSL